MEEPCFFRTLESGGAHDPWGRVWVLPRSVADLIALGTRRSSWRTFSESLNLHFARGFGFEVDDRSTEVEMADGKKGCSGSSVERRVVAVRAGPGLFRKPTTVIIIFLDRQHRKLHLSPVAVSAVQPQRAR